MAIKKYTVKASAEAKAVVASKGEYISAAQFSDTLKSAKKKFNEKFKKGPYACAEYQGMGYIYYNDGSRIFVPSVCRTYDEALAKVKQLNAGGAGKVAASKSFRKTVKASSSLKVKPYVINKGQSGEYYGLKNAEDNQVLHSAPNNWKSEKGAISWAKKKGYEVVDSACGKKPIETGRTKMRPRDQWVVDDACRYTLFRDDTGDLENSDNKAELIRLARKIDAPAWVEDNSNGDIVFNNMAQQDKDNLDTPGYRPKSAWGKKSVKAGRYSDAVPYENRKYWYFTTHGIGPGMLPKGVNVLDTQEGQNRKGTWGDYLLLDAVLNTDELREYDLVELAPLDKEPTIKPYKNKNMISVFDSCGKKSVKASELLSGIDKLPERGKVITKTINGNPTVIVGIGDNKYMYRSYLNKANASGDVQFIRNLIKKGEVPANAVKNLGYKLYTASDDVESACGKKSIKSSKSVKKFGIKASKSAKKRVANKRITANSDSYYNEDIVFYFNGKKQFEGSIFDLAGIVEILCHDPKVMQVFQDYCNQFGDPFDFDGTPRDTALVFTKLVMFEAEGANEPSDFYIEYSDYRKPGSFEIFYANEGIYSAKSIKCWDNGNDVWEYQESYDNYYDEEPPEHIGKELERLAKLTDKYMNMWFDKFEELHPNERYSNVYDFPDVDEAVGFTRDAAEYYPDQIEIGASKSIKCNDGIAPDDYDSVEDLVPEAYALSGGEDDDMLEYVDDYIATEGCPATVNFVTYNTPNDWSVDVSKYGENVVSDFIWYLEEVASELSDKFYDYPSYEDDTTRNAFKGTKYEEGGKYATFYGDNALAADDYEFQFYPAQNQWSAPQIEFDTDELKLIGFTDDEIDELMRIYEDYKVAWVENCKYINAHISEFLANLESNVNASKNIKAGLSLNLNAKPNYTDWILRGYKFDGEDVTTIRIDFQDDVRQAVTEMFADPDIDTVDLYKIPTDQDTTGVFEDEEYFNTITREDFESSADINAAIDIGNKTKYSDNSIYEFSDYVEKLSDGVQKILGDDFEVTASDEVITFTKNGEVIYIQPTEEIIPEPEDLESDIDELATAVNSVLYDKAMREDFDRAWDETYDEDYATQAVELSRDINCAEETVDIDDLEYIMGDTSAEDRIFDVIVDKLRTSELSEFGEVDILSGDADIKVYPDGADIDYIIAFVADPITINFEDRFMKYEKYPDYNMLNHTQHINGLTTEIIVHNGTIGAVNYVDLDGYGLSNYDIPAYEKYVEQLARPVVEEIYNFVDQAVYDGNITSSTAVTADVDDEPNDWGFGFDSNGDPVDESTVDELERIAQEILDKSEIHNVDEYADLHNFNYYASIPYIQESFDITFTYVADIYELSDRGLVKEYGIFTTVAPYNIHLNVRCKNGEVEYAECTEVDVKDNYGKDVELKNFNLDALVQFATDLVNPVAMDIYNGTTNI